MPQEIPPSKAYKAKHGEAPATSASMQANTPSAKHEGGGLPQLNANDFAPQLVWLALTFGVLYWIMSRIALPGIADVIEKRRDHINNDIDAAKRFKHQSEAAELAYKTALADAKNQAHAIAQQTKDDLNVTTDLKRAEVDMQISAKIAEAEQRITVAKSTALKEVNTIAGSTTSEIVHHLIGQTTSDSDLANALKKVAMQ